MSTTQYPILIVGQGIAGSMLAYHCHLADLPFQIIDKKNPNASSRIAAGLINPITGRILAKSWLFHQLYDYAKTFYPELEKTLDLEFFSKTSLIRLLKTEKEKNEFAHRVDLPEYEGMMSDSADLEQLNGLQTEEGKLITIHGLAISRGALMLPRLRKWFLGKELLINQSFDFSQLRVAKDELASYKGQKYQRIIFCEGYRMKYNPYFSYLPMVPAKGNRLLVSCPELPLLDCAKFSQTMIPTEIKGQYWVGSNYDRSQLDEIATPEGMQVILHQLDKMLKLPYKILDHKAAPRPATKDRRPLVGLHPEFNSLGVFNGMGSKGFSLAPFLAKQFVDHLQNGSEIHPRVSITRFQQLYTTIG